MSISEDAITALDAGLKIAQRLKQVSGDQSLIEYSQPTRVEPIVMIDERAVFLPYMTDVMQSLTSIFAGYYLQALALSVNVGRVDVIKTLDRLNPNRKLFYSFEGRPAMIDADKYEHSLPMPGQATGMEAFGLEDTNREIQVRDSGKIVSELANLSVGKLLEVTLEDGGKKATFPVGLRLIANSIKSDVLAHTLTVNTVNNKSMKDRFHMWRAGQLRFMRDLIFAQDLIEEHRKTLMRDDKGVYAAVMKRRQKNRMASILSGSPSIATASNLMVITDTTRKEVERMGGGRLEDFKTREQMFKGTYLMLLVVIDPEWEQLTIYHRSIDTPTELSVKDVKGQSRGSGPDVTEILKAYQLGNSPSL